MNWQNYWVQWWVQNVLPPSFWTLVGIAASHVAQRRRQDGQHDERMRQAERHHQDLKTHVTGAVVKPVIEQMSDAEFEKQLAELMRRNPAVLDAFLRTRARKQHRPRGGERM